MAKYYYEQWSKKPYYDLGSPYASGTVYSATMSGYTGRGINQDTGLVYMYGSFVDFDTSLSQSGYFYTLYNYSSGGQILIVRSFNGSYPGQFTKYQRDVIVDGYQKGTYITTIIAEDGTYPDNGESGDYWYVKTDKVFPELQVNINGTWRTAESGWVNINGTWREISGVWANINGIWKES